MINVVKHFLQVAEWTTNKIPSIKWWQYIVQKCVYSCFGRQFLSETILITNQYIIII